MSGNVYEWVNDWERGDYYSVSPYIDPKGPINGEYRVLRGGSWGGFMWNSIRLQGGNEKSCRLSYRNSAVPFYWGGIDVGFRLVLDL
jgi:formylglycine-generating enzyme required for sulfatase activity